MRASYLVPVLAVLAMLVAGVGAAFSSGNMSASNGAIARVPGMMDGTYLKMDGEGAYRGAEMGSFDKDRPFDLQFIDQMIAHHQMAILSSEHMISDSERPELRELAQNIQKSQSEQIEQMREWRRQWYPDARQASGMSDGMMDETMGGGMMGGDVPDAMFLRMMIPHHQTAIDMSEKALREAEHPEIRELARKIIDEQSEEIVLMQGYLEEVEAEGS